MGMAFLHIVHKKDFFMKKKSARSISLSVFLLAFFSVLLSNYLYDMGKYQEYRGMKLSDDWYRAHFFDEEMKKAEDYLSEDCASMYRNVRDEVTYFPVPVSLSDSSLTVSFVDTWQAERNYKGKRGHEGTDIMAGKNERGLYPVVSMTDGTISSLGWLEKGGYRVGITSESGIYYYYAHLDSYSDITEGDRVKAGDIIGFMGDTGYGEEGTTGKFPVHLHVGIYAYKNGEEISVNPYYVLLSVENKRLKWYT